MESPVVEDEVVTQDKELTEIEQVAKSYLVDLGLTWEQLKDKKVLDLGAGSGGFAQVAKQHGIEVISVDKYSGGMENSSLPEGVEYVVSNADKLPFEDSSFDVIVARAFMHGEEKAQIEAIIKEAKRVLKEGGEFRFGPGSLNAGIFAREGHFQGEQLDHNNEESLDKRLKAISDLSINYLKSVDPNIQMFPGNPKREKYNGTYYLLKNSKS